MPKVITVSRHFMKGHPKAGQPTYFVEKILNSFNDFGLIFGMPSGYFDVDIYANCRPKHHTIRSGKRWNTGDMASIRVWSGRPYNSPQIIIAPDIPITVKDIEISWDGEIYIDGKFHSEAVTLAMNDGLTEREFDAWFNKLPFSGQILVWNNNNLPY